LTILPARPTFASSGRRGASQRRHSCLIKMDGTRLALGRFMWALSGALVVESTLPGGPVSAVARAEAKRPRRQQAPRGTRITVRSCNRHAIRPIRTTEASFWLLVEGSDAMTRLSRPPQGPAGLPVGAALQSRLHKNPCIVIEALSGAARGAR
jgi:hypothetical protein